MKRCMPFALIVLLSLPLAAAPDDQPAPDPTTAPAPAASPDAKAQAEAERVRRQKEAVEFVAHYFEHPDLDAVPGHVRTLSATGWMATPRNYTTLLAFLAALLQAHPDKAEPWMDAWSTLPDQHFAVLIGAVWISNIDHADEIMMHQLVRLNDEWQGVIHGQYAEEPFDIFTEPEMEAYHLEMLWGWYCATGDEKCLERVLFFTEDDREDNNLAADATASLSCNAAVYPSVHNWCTRQLEKVTSDPEHALHEAPQLEGILEDSEYFNANRAALKLSDFGVPRD